MSALLMVALVLAATPEPSYLVERVVRVEGQTRRVTLFRDGTAVLLRRDGAGNEDLRHVQVGSLVYGQIEQVVREVYPEMTEFATMGNGPGTGTVELRLAPPGIATLVFRLAVASSPSAATARLGATLDALEERIIAGKAPPEDLRLWEPRVGERVEMDDGRVVTILDVMGTASGGGVVWIRAGSSMMRESLDVEDLRRRAVRRVTEETK
ncbi:MAG: hypothetical protein MUF10_14000 [Thermoanaerobaculaceae bacterium]|nr:hypothetical protein [Thermoanaerobaculaceae bacterium]